MKDKMKQYGITGVLLIAPIVGIGTYLSLQDSSDAPLANETTSESVAPNMDQQQEQVVEKPSVKINESIFFAFDSYRLNASASSMLDDIALSLKSDPNSVWQIQGNTDVRGTEAYNNALGAKRAEAVKDYLVSKGVASNTLNTISYGESTPVSLKNDEEAHAVNRRVEFAKVTALTQR